MGEREGSAQPRRNQIRTDLKPGGGIESRVDTASRFTPTKDGGLTDEAGLPGRIGVERLGRIALEDLAFFIDVVTLSVDRRRLGVGVQGCHRLRDRPRQVEVVGVEVRKDAPTRPSLAFVDRVSLPVVRL